MKSDPNRILLENDRRIHELGIIDPNGDREKINELYGYLWIKLIFIFFLN